MPTTPKYALPYPAPADPADVPADMQELADQLEIVLGQLGRPSCRLRHSVAVTIPATSIFMQPFDTEVFDIGAMHDAANNSRLVFPQAGRYVVGASVVVTAGSAGLFQIRLTDGATTRHAEQSAQPSAAGQVMSISLSTLVSMAAGSYMELVYNNQLTGTTQSTTALMFPGLWAYFVGA
jgi:hypothetical protein